MSSISALGPLTEYAPDLFEEKRDDVEIVKEQPKQEVLAPVVEAHMNQQDQKTTIQSSQYTGKGSFIDKVF